MIRSQGLFEEHLNVTGLERAMQFYGDTLNLEFAAKFDEPKVAFYWIGGRGHTMLGLWQVGAGPQRVSLHVALTADLDDVLDAPRRLLEKKVQPLDFVRKPTSEAVVIGWMPAAVVYFCDPDGNLLEFLAMLPEPADASAGVIPWSRWRELHPRK